MVYQVSMLLEIFIFSSRLDFFQIIPKKWIKFKWCHSINFTNILVCLFDSFSLSIKWIYIRESESLNLIWTYEIQMNLYFWR